MAPSRKLQVKFPPASLKAGGKGEEKAAQEGFGSRSSFSTFIIPNPITEYSFRWAGKDSLLTL